MVAGGEQEAVEQRAVEQGAVEQGAVEQGAVERARPVLATFGDPIVHLGPLGAGLVTKVAGPLLQKDVRLLAEVAAAGVAPGTVLTAADDALGLLGFKR
jgi:3-hydroxyisobutyrate dehydrogenase-like beta-hydroxyacid dehydrogenase